MDSLGLNIFNQLSYLITEIFKSYDTHTVIQYATACCDHDL